MCEGCVDVTEHGSSAVEVADGRWNALDRADGISMSNFDTARDKSRATTGDSIDTDLDERDVRALTQYLTVLDDYGRARDADHLYMVVSESGEEYLVDTRTGSCECPDYEHRNPTGGCKHRRRVAFATGSREIPVSVDRDAVDEQLGLHVQTTPRQAATDGGMIVAGDDGEILDDSDDGHDERPDACECEPWMGSEGLPCFECWRRDFETPNPAVLEGDDTDDSDRPQRSEPADFGGGESTGVQDLLGGDGA